MTKKPLLLKILDIVTAVLFVAALYMVLFYAGREEKMGDVQRVFYFHVSAGWGGMIGFLLALVSGILYLITGNRKWDVLELAGVEIGLVLMVANIVSGSVWARPVWNTWWTWDPRLVTATIMELVYVAYLMLRQGIEDPDRRARFGAIYAIIGFVSVPFTFLSIRILRTIHPTVIANASGEKLFDMTGSMKTAFFFSLFTFTFIGIDLLWHRVRLGKLADEIEQRKLKAME